jgi:hypothetical protein
MSRLRPAGAALLLVLGIATPAAADFTAFLGLSPSPETHLAKGLAVGGGLLVVGFEFEYSHLSEDTSELVPSVRTGMGNVLLQTPIPVSGWQFYFTVGGGVYRERLAERSETSFVGNIGGGAKVTLAGPLRARFDYRILNLQGDPLYSRVHRFYAGLNLAF